MSKKESTPKGKCPKCGKEYYGWALLEGDDKCKECGIKLEIIVDQGKTDKNKQVSDSDPR